MQGCEELQYKRLIAKAVVAAAMQDERTAKKKAERAERKKKCPVSQ